MAESGWASHHTITAAPTTLVRITMGARTGILGRAFVGIAAVELCALALGTDVKYWGCAYRLNRVSSVFCLGRGRLLLS